MKALCVRHQMSLCEVPSNRRRTWSPLCAAYGTTLSSRAAVDRCRAQCHLWRSAAHRLECTQSERTTLLCRHPIGLSRPCMYAHFVLLARVYFINYITNAVHASWHFAIRFKERQRKDDARQVATSFAAVRSGRRGDATTTDKDRMAMTTLGSPAADVASSSLLSSTKRPSSTAEQPAYLASLSEAQREAVTAPADEPLQILAGPGSGKTRVLVSRVAWLNQHHAINPRDLIVVTFTNKAANEMRVRLTKLIGAHRTSLLAMGTFHAMCAKYLRQYASLVGIGNNFSICDADESKKVIKAIIKEKASVLASRGAPPNLRPEVCMSEISRAKARNLDPQAYLSSLNEIQATSSTSRRPESTVIRRAAAEVYKHYAEHLRKNNALDFDDLLVYGLKLFSEHPRVIANVRHVLVDEFQDTNTIQYTLMACLAGRGGGRGAVSIVGDPDQSIYGWRSAEVGNLDRMANEFKVWSPNNVVRRVFLEQNYRSTGHILQTAKAIIESSSSRIDRGLYTSHANGPSVVLKQFNSAQMEASFIATEVKRLVAHTGGLFDYDDFAILLRFNALSREVEQQLLAENIPSRIMGGARFFERKEVKDLLAYLTLADNPQFTPALERVINVPKRAIGDKTVKDLQSLAETEGVRTMTIIERVADAPKPIMGIKPNTQKSLRNFVEAVREIRETAMKKAAVADIIQQLMDKVGYQDHLKKEPDFDQRWENVKELINFSTLIAMDAQTANGVGDDGQPSLLAQLKQISSSMPPSSVDRSQKRSSPDVIDLLSSGDEEDVHHSPSVKKSERKAVKESTESKAQRVMTEEHPKAEDPVVDSADKSPLRIFLEACTLSTDMEQKEDEKGAKVPKVTIATAHAAKGLEFPVVFVLAVEEGTYPFYRSSGSAEEVDEEARLLYVAITRAQALAYMTYCATRHTHGEAMDKTLSRFVSRIADAGKIKGGLWRDNSSTTPQMTQAGGFMSYGAGFQAAKPPTNKIDFATKRPSIGLKELKTFAAVLNRPLPSDKEADKLRQAFDNSDVASRAKRADGAPQERFPSAGMGIANRPSSLFALDPSTIPIAAIQRASSLMSSSGTFGSSNGAFSRSDTFGNTTPSFMTASNFGKAASRPPPLSMSNNVGASRPLYSGTSNYSSGAGGLQASSVGGSRANGSGTKRLGTGRAPTTFPKRPKEE